MADIFLSYAREDRARVELLVEALKNAGFQVFWDLLIPAGTGWREELESRIRDSKCVVVVWTALSVQQQWVREEADFSRSLRKYLPVRFDQTDLPLGFREIQALDLIGWQGDQEDCRLRDLIDAVSSYSPAKVDLKARPRGKVQIRRRWISGLTGILAVGICSILLWCHQQNDEAAKKLSNYWQTSLGVNHVFEAKFKAAPELRGFVSNCRETSNSLRKIDPSGVDVEVKEHVFRVSNAYEMMADLSERDLKHAGIWQRVFDFLKRLPSPIFFSEYAIVSPPDGLNQEVWLEIQKIRKEVSESEQRVIKNVRARYRVELQPW